MSVTGGTQETHRAQAAVSVPLGGLTEDIRSIQAQEDREIVAVALDDTGGAADVVGEISFSSNARLSSNNSDDSRASVIARGGQGPVVTGLSITWNAGEEVHIHGINNSGADEDLFVTIYYREV